MAFKVNNKYLYSTAFDGTSDKSSPVMPFAKTDGTYPIVNSSVTTCLAPPPACSPTSSLGSGTARRFMSNRDGDVSTADSAPFGFFRRLNCEKAIVGNGPNAITGCDVSTSTPADAGFGGVSSTTNFVDPNNTSNYLLPPIQCQSAGSRKLSNIFHGWAESDYARNWLGINGPLGGPRAEPIGVTGAGGHVCRDYPTFCKGSEFVTPWGYKKYSAEITSFYTHSVGEYVCAATGCCMPNKCCGTITNGSVMWRNCFHNATNFLWHRWTAGYGMADDTVNTQITPTRFESGCGSMAVDGGSPFASKRFMTRIGPGRWAPGYQVRQNWSGCWRTTDETSIDGVTSSPSQILPDNSYITGCHNKGSACLNSGNFSSYSWHGACKLYDQWNNCSATNSWAVGQQAACADGAFDGDWIFPHCYHWHDPAKPKGFHVGMGFEADFSDECGDKGCLNTSLGGMYGMMANTIMLEKHWNLTYSNSYASNFDMKYWSGNLCSSGGCCSLGKVPHSGTFSQTANISFSFVNNDACSGISSISYS